MGYFKRAARLEKLDQIPMAMIVDSPWIPGHLGIKHMDYFLDPELWFQSNKKVNEEFPDIIMARRGGWNTAWPPNRPRSARR